LISQGQESDDAHARPFIIARIPNPLYREFQFFEGLLWRVHRNDRDWHHTVSVFVQEISMKHIERPTAGPSQFFVFKCGGKSPMVG